METITIYKAVNKKNQLIYIGQTNRTLEVRMQEHYTSGRTRFSKAVQRDGLDGFEWSVLEIYNTRDEANVREVELIAEHGSYAKGYNSHPGGRVGGKTTKESITKRQATREASGGYESVSKRQRENNVAHRPEVQKKIADSVKKLWEDPVYRANQLAKKEQANPVVKCPHCGREGRNAIMQRHHFKNCKSKHIS
jgi:group I intron endonuclease